MDIQTLLNAMSDHSRRERSRYHVTLGMLHGACCENPEANVIVDGKGGLSNEHSYRGYYDDLSFEHSAKPSAAAEVLAACERALSDTYEGYKGGDFTYAPDTPLWLAWYGCTGRAIVSIDTQGEVINLVTRDVD